jgi:hypothetical protein
MATKANLALHHKKTRLNRSSLVKSASCGCFYCFSEFLFDQIVEWIDDHETALCPYCGVDAVLGFGTQNTDQELLHEMHDRWFKPSLRLTPEEWKNAIERNVWPPARMKPSTRE